MLRKNVDCFYEKHPIIFDMDQIGIGMSVTMLPAILDIKLKHLDEYNAARRTVADQYDQYLADIPQIQCPKRSPNSDHVFHQYTLKVPSADRNTLKSFLADKGIPSMIYYPLPLYEQKAFKSIINKDIQHLSNTSKLCDQVLSLPIHTEMPAEQVEFITEHIRSFF